MANLASTYRSQGRWEEAEKLEAQVISTRQTKLGADHPDTLNSMANLALTLWNQGRWKEAEKLFVQVMGTSKMKLGVDHPDTLTSMNNLAFTWKGQGKVVKATSLMSECVQRRQRILGVDHPHFISSSRVSAEWGAEEAEISSASSSVAGKEMALLSTSLTGPPATGRHQRLDKITLHCNYYAKCHTLTMDP